MTTVETVVINKSDTTLELNLLNTGIFSKLATLPQKCGKYTIRCNTNATFLEYWVGTGLEGGTVNEVSINTDDCGEYQTIYIINDPADPTKVILERIARGVVSTEVVNQTDGEVTVSKNGGADPHVLKKDQKFVIKSDPKEAKDCNYSVKLAGGNTIPISTNNVAKAQRINIISEAKTVKGGGQKITKLGMVSRGLFLTEVVNTTSSEIKVNEGRSNAHEEVAALMKDEKYTIIYDPKKDHKDHKFWTVEYPSTNPAGTSSTQTLDITTSDVAEFERIEVIEGDSSGTKTLERLEARPCETPGKNGFASKFLGLLGIKT